MVGIINTNKTSLHDDGVTAAPISPTSIVHSVTDDGDFSGVVDGPALKVKEIRSRFKNRDFESYTKPKPMNASSIDRRPNVVTNNQQAPKRNSYMSSSSSRSSCSENDFPNPIAQDVMSLFQIVDAEKDLNAVFDDLQIQQQPTSKRKVPPPVPPKRTHSSAESVKTKRESLTRRSTDLTDSPALPTTNAAQTQEEKEQEDIDIKTRIQKIKKQSQEVETLEESLDDFYSLLDSY